MNYLLLALITLLTLFSCVEKGTTDSNHPSTTPPLSIDYGISEDFYIALTNTALELIQKGNFGSQSNFSISPSLPNGLFLNTTNGNISGTPTNSSQPTTYTITATKDSKTYTKAISLGVAPSVAWVTPVSSNYLKAYVVGDGAKQTSDWTWGSSDDSLATVNNGVVSFQPTTTGGTVFISASKNSYSNGISITLEDVGVGKIITMGTSIHLMINSGTTKATNRQFKNQGLTSVIIPNSVTYINFQAFAANKLTRVVIPNSVTNIGDYAFFGNQLTNVVISDNVTNIGNSAFLGNQLTSVIIPNSVTNIGGSAFAENQLTKVVMPNNVTYIAGSAFYHNQLTNVVIPNSVITIGIAAFNYNRLTSLIIPNSITSIGNSAFQNNQLTNLVIPSSLTNINSSTFSFNQLVSLTIPNSVTSIGSSAFQDNQLTRVMIPDSVTNIGNNAFTSNPNLLVVDLKQSLYNWITSNSSTNAVFGTQVTNYIKRP